jgi:hypothetical protein
MSVCKSQKDKVTVIAIPQLQEKQSVNYRITSSFFLAMTLRSDFLPGL